VTIASIGFALAFGVLVDAFLVRMTFVPVVHTLLGDRAWHLPKWIDRVLPNVDVEGAALTERLDAHAVPEPAQP
jgi:putative drug exporter of the RND superfamily